MRGKSKQQQKPIYGSFQSSHFLSKIRHCCEILNGGMTKDQFHAWDNYTSIGIKL